MLPDWLTESLVVISIMLTTAGYFALHIPAVFFVLIVFAIIIIFFLLRYGKRAAYQDRRTKYRYEGLKKRFAGRIEDRNLNNEAEKLEHG